MKHKVIGISQSFSPAPFVRALKERLQSTFLPDGSRPRIELVDLDWSSPDADAPKLVQEGDVMIRVLEESYQLIEKGALVIALCNFRNRNHNSCDGYPSGLHRRAQEESC